MQFPRVLKATPGFVVPSAIACGPFAGSTASMRQGKHAPFFKVCTWSVLSVSEGKLLFVSSLLAQMGVCGTTALILVLLLMDSDVSAIAEIHEQADVDSPLCANLHLLCVCVVRVRQRERERVRVCAVVDVRFQSRSRFLGSNPSTH